MAIMRPDPELAWLRADAADLDRKLREGDGMGFPGDHRLWLGQGVITAKLGGFDEAVGRIVRRGDILGRRWEVWRDCEDGETRLIGAWKMNEFDRILIDLASLRMDSPGHVDTIDQIDAHNAAVDADNSRDVQDVLGAALEHTTLLVHDRTEPRNVFRGMPGLRDCGNGAVDAAETVAPDAAE